VSVAQVEPSVRRAFSFLSILFCGVAQPGRAPGPYPGSRGIEALCRIQLSPPLLQQLRRIARLVRAFLFSRSRMPNIKVLTRDGQGRGAVLVQGSRVMVGDQLLDGVVSVRLDGEAGGLWTLTLDVRVDPNSLFGVLPREVVDKF
jgi:hypothetical protein